MNPLKQIAPQVDPITGMAIQPGQMQTNQFPNQNALGPAQAAKIPGLFPGSAFMQTTKLPVADLLNAENSRDGGKATQKIKDAQAKALAKKKEKEAAAKKASKESKDVVSGKKNNKL